MLMNKKMNWMIFLLLVFITASAQESKGLIGETVTEKTSRAKLQIDDGEGMMMSYAEANMVIANKFFGLKDRLNSRRWRGYNGITRVSEPRFFEIAGFPEEARFAMRYQSIRQGVFWTGTGLAFLGVLISSIQLLKDRDENNDEWVWKWKNQVFGIGLFTTGLAVDGVWFFSPSNRYSLRTALNAADKYNKRE